MMLSASKFPFGSMHRSTVREPTKGDRQLLTPDHPTTHSIANIRFVTVKSAISPLVPLPSFQSNLFSRHLFSTSRTQYIRVELISHLQRTWRARTCSHTLTRASFTPVLFHPTRIQFLIRKAMSETSKSTAKHLAPFAPCLAFSSISVCL